MQHPEFEQERSHLAYVKHYMANVLEESARDVETAQEDRKSVV